jgi:hypothetical protein
MRPPRVQHPPDPTGRTRPRWRTPEKPGDLLADPLSSYREGCGACVEALQRRMELSPPGGLERASPLRTDHVSRTLPSPALYP